MKCLDRFFVGDEIIFDIAEGPTFTEIFLDKGKKGLIESMSFDESVIAREPVYRKGKILEFYEKENKKGSKELMAKVDFLVAITKIPYTILERRAKYEHE